MSLYFLSVMRQMPIIQGSKDESFPVRADTVKSEVVEYANRDDNRKDWHSSHL